MNIRTWRQRLRVAALSFFRGGGAPAAARGVRHVLDDVALATARCAPNMFSNEAPTAARGVLFAVSTRAGARVGMGLRVYGSRVVFFVVAQAIIGP